MATLKKYNLSGKETGSVEVHDEWVDVEVNGQLIKDYIVAIRANARQWSASTKGKGEVKCSNKKPHKQKGLGRARQGSLASPQFKGGGIVFGPKPKFNQHVRINKKERQQAIRYLLANMVKEGHVVVLEDTIMEKPQTKSLVSFIDSIGAAGRRTLFVSEGSYAEIPEFGGRVDVYSEKHDNFVKSMNNIPRATFRLAKNISGYDVMIATKLIVTESALKEILEWLK